MKEERSELKSEPSASTAADDHQDDNDIGGWWFTRKNTPPRPHVPLWMRDETVEIAQAPPAPAPKAPKLKKDEKEALAAEALRAKAAQVSEAVRKYPCLCDPNNALFGNDEWQRAAWREIRKQTGISDAEKIWKSCFSRKKNRICIAKPFVGLLDWLGENLEAVGRAVDREKALVIIHTVRQLPALYDPNHPRFHDEPYKKYLWLNVKDSVGIDDAKGRWLSMVDFVVKGKTPDDGFWYAHEMEWARQYVEPAAANGNASASGSFDKSLAAGYASMFAANGSSGVDVPTTQTVTVPAAEAIGSPTPSDSQSESHEVDGAPDHVNAKLLGSSELALTCMLGSIHDTLSVMSMEKRWKVFAKFREAIQELKTDEDGALKDDGNF